MKLPAIRRNCNRLQFRPGTTVRMVSFLLLTAGIQIQASASPLPIIPGSTNTNARFGPPVKGRVTTANGEAMIGVTIMVKATKKGTNTNEKGEFTINASPEDILVITYLGYETQEVKVGNNTTLNIVLSTGATQLNDVAIVGYGKQKRAALTSAITSVKPGDLNRGAITDLGQLLQGKVPGLNITASGDPNRPAAVILRGTSTLNSSQTPFYVIDGVPGMDISLIAPDDITNIEVLKDAAATAIYGNRASAGVIIVTTRKGKSGNLTVSYNSYVGAEKISSNLKVMSADELRSFLTKNGSGFSPNDDLGAHTNWQKEIERETAVSQNHNIAFSGGTDHSNYVATLNYANKEGIIQKTSLERMIARLAVEQYALNDNVKFGLNISNSISNAKDLPYRNTILLQSALYLPVSPVKNADGTYFENLQYSNYYNPVAMLNNSEMVTKNNNFSANFTTNVKLPWGFSYDLSASYMNVSTLGGQYLSKYYTSKYNGMYDNPDPAGYGHSQQTFGTNGQATRSSYTNTYKILESFLTWNRHFGNHNINAVAGYSWQSNVIGDGFSTTTYNFAVDNTSFKNLALSNPYAYSTQINLGSDGVYQETKLISDFARVNYDYKEKYLLQGSIRHDGSSVFGANHRWGYFPSVGIGWRISQEPFMKNQQLFNDLKFRASYGVTGNSSGFSAFSAQYIIGSNGSFYYNGSTLGAFGPTQAQNADLQWEKTATTNIGLDFAILKSRLTGSLEVYNKNTTGMIWSYSVNPALVPTGSIVANGGSMNNKGIELSLSAAIVEGHDFSWNSTLNLASNKNRITSLRNPLFSGGDSVAVAYPEGASQSGASLQLLKTGHPLGQFFTFEYAGKNASGMSQYIAGDGSTTTAPINGTDYHYLGSAQPKLLYGWANTFKYKHWDLNVFVRGVYGNKIFNATRADLFRPSTAQYSNILADAKDESTSDANSYKYSSRFIEPGSYLRFDNATLAYTFGNINPTIKKLRLYFSVNNLFVITKYKGVDPEVNQGGIAPGVDYNNFYPKTRTFLIGANLAL
ncbi:TonB-dependent receptor [Chitinophaga silvisoli]|uniref:TonB-dependent receptor n=2 Tax=Chitinophaga silvisoli TaxID=2291814 RepID=A0A3E1P2T5_9BACT|nr:TonB-dependent receptor [Chitinophaga silvisoli]